MAEDGTEGDVSGVLRLREKDAAPVSAHVKMAGEMDVVIEFTTFETIDAAGGQDHFGPCCRQDFRKVPTQARRGACDQRHAPGQINSI